MKKAIAFFKTGNYVLILTGIFHLIGHFQKPIPENDQEKMLFDLLENYYFDFGNGIERSFGDIMNSLSLALSLFTFFIAIYNLLLIGQNPGEAILKKIMLLNIIFLGILELIIIRYTILPPMICYGLSWLLILISYLIILKADSSGKTT